jgi:hypothetical protein
MANVARRHLHPAPWRLRVGGPGWPAALLLVVLVELLGPGCGDVTARAGVDAGHGSDALAAAGAGGGSAGVGGAGVGTGGTGAAGVGGGAAGAGGAPVPVCPKTGACATIVSSTCCEGCTIETDAGTSGGFVTETCTTPAWWSSSSATGYCVAKAADCP